ncbi:hypothetical protein GJ744_001779 [Endocarpon pusillum]|uniref:Uncharacterized protein n=1 Tax=Endocarpon pusillum TaxID=364733 RepID=A0A8H7AGF1_9EURO|nr:hypothetical protein GJ744_001779 [Endocarpon pusillum]
MRALYEDELSQMFKMTRTFVSATSNTPQEKQLYARSATTPVRVTVKPYAIAPTLVSRPGTNA